MRHVGQEEDSMMPAVVNPLRLAVEVTRRGAIIVLTFETVNLQEQGMSLHRLQSVGRGATENLTGATGGHLLQGQGQSQESCAIIVSNRHVTLSDETLATTTLATRLTFTTTELTSQARQLAEALAEVAVEEIGNFVVGDGVACMMAAIFSLREVVLRAVFVDQTTSYVTIDPP